MGGQKYHVPCYMVYFRVYCIHSNLCICESIMINKLLEYVGDNIAYFIATGVMGLILLVATISFVGMHCK